MYLVRDRNLYLEYVQSLDYTLDPNVFNFVLNLVLDKLDFETGLLMFELVFEGKLTKMNINNVDASKQCLKILLKLQMIKTQAGQGWQLEKGARSEIESIVISNPAKLKLEKMHQDYFPELKDFDASTSFEIIDL